MKNTTVSFTLSIAVAVALSASAFAQNATPAPGATPGGRGARMNPAERLKAMKEKLNLTDEQSDKVKAILEKSAENFKSLQADTTIARQEKMAKYREAAKAASEEVLAVLTPEQQKIYKEEADKRRAEFEKRRAAAGAPGASTPAPATPKAN